MPCGCESVAVISWHWAMTAACNCLTIKTAVTVICLLKNMTCINIYVCVL